MGAVNKLLRIMYIIMNLIAGVMLLILLYDLQVGNIIPGIVGGKPTLPHQAYILVLPALINIMYRILKSNILI